MKFIEAKEKLRTEIQKLLFDTKSTTGDVIAGFKTMAAKLHSQLDETVTQEERKKLTDAVTNGIATLEKKFAPVTVTRQSGKPPAPETTQPGKSTHFSLSGATKAFSGEGIGAAAASSSGSDAGTPGVTATRTKVFTEAHAKNTSSFTQGQSGSDNDDVAPPNTPRSPHT